jgi:hypothetical protein
MAARSRKNRKKESHKKKTLFVASVFFAAILLGQSLDLNVAIQHFATGIVRLQRHGALI